MSIALAFAAAASAPGTLTLPAGFVQVLEEQRIYAIAGWVVAVGVSSTVFLVARPRPQPPFPSALLEQLTGYLAGRGAEVIRTDIRFPLGWQQYGTSRSTIRFWLLHFMAEGWKRRLLVTIPPHKGYPIVLPLAAGAEAALHFWSEVLLLMNALAQDDPESMLKFRPTLWEVAQVWERHWGGTVEHTKKNSTVRSEDWLAVGDADRAWANVVREHLEPHGYVTRPEMMARLL
jgi:hypothetical protein